MSQALAVNLNIYEILEEYNEKVKDIPIMFEDVKTRFNKLQNTCSTMGAYSGMRAFEHDFTMNNVKTALKSLQKSSWRFVFNALNIKDIAPKTHMDEFERLLEDPPEFTADAIKSVFKDYVTNPRGMALQAFAEVFCRLDRFYKSHSNIKVGVKGLPKRIIIGYCGEWHNSGNDHVADVVNALMRYRNEYDKVTTGHEFYTNIIKEGLSYHGLSFKLFKNGNCHIIFDKQALDDTNRALAEYYGEVIADAYEHTEKPSASKEVSKDLQFYKTSRKTVRKLLREVYLQSGQSVLEPSCGDGAILDGIAEKIREANKERWEQYHINNVKVIGVEFHSGRCEEAREKNHAVLNENFLAWETKARFDHIIMNPPFYGKHYAKHIAKAYELLADGGTITAILPVTAKMNHGIIDKEYPHCRWSDLPVGSFSESGTNINTVIVRIHK